MKTYFAEITYNKPYYTTTVYAQKIGAKSRRLTVKMSRWKRTSERWARRKIDALYAADRPVSYAEVIKIIE